MSELYNVFLDVYAMGTSLIGKIVPEITKPRRIVVAGNPY